MKDLLHVAVGGGDCLRRTATALTRTQIWRVPVPPVMFRMRLLVFAVPLLRLVEEFCKHSDIDRSGSCGFPFAPGKACRDFLEKPAVPVWILKRGKREVGTTLRVAPSDARVLDCIVEGAAGVVEHLADVDATGDQVLAGGIDIVHSEDQFDRARLGRSDS